MPHDKTKQDIAPRVCVVGDGVSALAAAYYLSKHGQQHHVTLVTSISNQDDSHDALSRDGHDAMVEAPVTGMLTRHGCPNLARWYDDMHVGLGFHDSGVAFAGEPTVSAAAKKRFCNTIPSELTKMCDSGALDAKTVVEFCSYCNLDAEIVSNWLLPLIASHWCAPLDKVQTMDAKTVFGRLFENGLLLPEGDGSGEKSAWWHFRPRGGMRAVQRRAIACMVKNGAHIIYNQDLSRLRFDVANDAAGGPSVLLRSELADNPLERYQHLVLGTDPDLSVALLRGCQQAAGIWSAMTAFGKNSYRSQVQWTRVSAQSLMPFEQAHACCLLNKGVDKIECATYWPRKLSRENYEHITHPDQNHVEVLLNVMKVAEPSTNEQLKGSFVTGTLVTPEVICQQETMAVEQGRRHIWCVGSFLQDGLQEGAVLSAVLVCRDLLSKSNIPIDVPSCRFRLHQRWTGHTHHRRSGAKKHSFKYQIRHDLVNVDVGLQRWWGGLYRQDHFGDPSVGLAETVRQFVCRETGEWPWGPVDFMGTLREWGYCFNPICLFFCWSSATRERVSHVVSVVTNTPWGQRSVHVLVLNDSVRDASSAVASATSYTICKEKILHVSPFNPTPNGESCWNYKITPLDHLLDRFSLIVESYADAKMETHVISATMVLRRDLARERTCLSFRCPYALLVQFRIHWQAILLFKKGLTFYANTSCPYSNAMVGSISHLAMMSVFAMALGVVALTLKIGLTTVP
jgi:DUF1365 family protein/predicted NAD/FAD-binding protein